MVSQSIIGFSIMVTVNCSVLHWLHEKGSQTPVLFWHRWKSMWPEATQMHMCPSRIKVKKNLMLLLNCGCLDQWHRHSFRFVLFISFRSVRAKHLCCSALIHTYRPGARPTKSGNRELWRSTCELHLPSWPNTTTLGLDSRGPGETNRNMSVNFWD